MSTYQFFLLALVAVMWLPRRSSRLADLSTGLVAGLLCLIRLSALGLVVPLFVLQWWQRDERRRLPALIASAMLVAVVTPSCGAVTARTGIRSMR